MLRPVSVIWSHYLCRRAFPCFGWGLADVFAVCAINVIIQAAASGLSFGLSVHTETTKPNSFAWE